MEILLKASLSLGYYLEEEGCFSCSLMCSSEPRTVPGIQHFSVYMLKKNMENICIS